MVELDEQGTIDTEHKIKECLVYTTEEYVNSEPYIERGGETGIQKISGGVYSHGVFKGVDPIYDYNRNKEIVNAKIGGIKNVFYIPWSRKTAEKLIAELGPPRRPCVVSFGRLGLRGVN